ncbi:Dehydrogenase/reductase SDR family member 7 [Portunus trituberculatus]|uniref:Dehydrogenase/reductase SDR family member 7 n=1 Tax=Portunus trituberculatus TaxID=210409 RepID=A0A5B7I4A6_PORTR|nr:Dehydrogenase/reductase SDR family member 7 [Portunus trituberculatus]
MSGSYTAAKHALHVSTGCCCRSTGQGSVGAQAGHLLTVLLACVVKVITIYVLPSSRYVFQGYFECLRTEKIGRGLAISMVCPGPVVSGLDEACFTDQLEKKLSEKRTGKMMSAERCAELFAVALANHLPETWIAVQPVLIIMYCSQYMPGLTKRYVGVVWWDDWLSVRCLDRCLCVCMKLRGEG